MEQPAQALDEHGRPRGDHPLAKWLVYFDEDGDGSIRYREFETGMKRIGFMEDLRQLFNEIDRDRSGSINIDEFDAFSADLWASFKRWSAEMFQSAGEMILRLSQGNKGMLINIADGRNRNHDRVVIHLTKAQFRQNAVRLGWYGSCEPLLFWCLDRKGQGVAHAAELDWFDEERKAHMRRVKIREKTRVGKGKQSGNSLRSLQSFSAFLRSQYGCLFRAWRGALDLDGSMTVERKELFKSCGDLHWHGDHASLWHALDCDDSGSTTLDELAAREARVLAQFKKWAEFAFHSVGAAFKAIVRTAKGLKLEYGEGDLGVMRGRTDRVSMSGWVAACRRLSFPESQNANEVFCLLDWEDDGVITFNEISFLQKWQPVEWLYGQPDQDAADAFKQALLNQYGHMVKAWRLVLDKDVNGRAGWKEFCYGANSINFTGDRAGAWLALDVHQVGFLTLHELDTEVAQSLAIFRRWSYAAFGGVMLCFKALDADDSGTLSLKEFKNAVRHHGCKADVVKLFEALNVDNDGTVSRTEIGFLDEWELDIMPYRGDARIESSSNRSNAKALQAKDLEHLQHINAQFETQAMNPHELFEQAEQATHKVDKPRKQHIVRGLPPFWVAAPDEQEGSSGKNICSIRPPLSLLSGSYRSAELSESVVDQPEEDQDILDFIGWPAVKQNRADVLLASVPKGTAQSCGAMTSALQHQVSPVWFPSGVPSCSELLTVASATTAVASSLTNHRRAGVLSRSRTAGWSSSQRPSPYRAAQRVLGRLPMRGAVGHTKVKPVRRDIRFDGV